ncbi:flagellar biosynthetic protein FliR [Sulfuricystis multivorans]|uniref:flagellar biosynthetic protein FliR n=1 Tax=Sulfuricystis multivorans TaxID=2211108 RepID=UPI000F82E9A1|nr:flagellar biosynthetic protein FliR [Sulfuricystis multivorans]
MISFTSAQLDAWINALLFPLARILALMSLAPIFGNAAQPRRVRLAVGLVVTFALVPALPPMPAVPAGSWLGLMILAQQVVIGLLLGLCLRIAFAAVDIAGELIGMQMSLSFAMFYDPQNAGQTPVVAEFLGLIAMLIFLALDGHLLTLAALAESFRLLPVSITPFAAEGIMSLLAWSAVMFSFGILLALPLITALLIANLAMGVLARVAPQLNIFAVGFPVTLTAGFVVLMFSIPYFGTALERLFDQAFRALAQLMRALGTI